MKLLFLFDRVQTRKSWNKKAHQINVELGIELQVLKRSTYQAKKIDKKKCKNILRIQIQLLYL
jgi:hypothetical protein